MSNAVDPLTASRDAPAGTVRGRPAPPPADSPPSPDFPLPALDPAGRFSMMKVLVVFLSPK
jgi:hypothetical protein